MSGAAWTTHEGRQRFGITRRRPSSRWGRELIAASRSVAAGIPVTLPFAYRVGPD